MRRLHQSQQSVSKGLLPATEDRPNGRRHRRLRAVILLGCLFRIQPNPHGPGRPGENCFYLRTRPILLHCYAFWPQKRRSHLSKLINKMFRKQLGKTMEAYIDDMVVKSKLRQNHINDLKETFAVLRHYGMKLNPAKCAFGVSSGQFLGYIVSKRGMKPNPEKVEAILQTGEPETKKDIQVLTGRIAALSRFISRSTDRCKPFFRALRSKQIDFWGPEQSEDLANLKQYLSSRNFLAVPHTCTCILQYQK